jgi:hypothetical protein
MFTFCAQIFILAVCKLKVNFKYKFSYTDVVMQILAADKFSQRLFLNILTYFHSQACSRYLKQISV